MTDPNRESAANPTGSNSWMRDVAAPRPEDFGLELLSASDIIRQAERHRFAPPRRALAAVAGLAASVALVVAIPLVSSQRDNHGPDDASPRPSASATVQYTVASDLLLAAATSSRHDDVDPSGRYLYVKSLQVFANRDSPREVWLGRDRPGVLRQDGLTESLPPAQFSFDGRLVSWSELESLPTDPKALETVLRSSLSNSATDPDVRLVKVIAELLAESPARPALRSALWLVLANIPGAGAIDSVVDQVGRAGWALRFSGRGADPVVLVVDPTTGELLETRHLGTPAWKVVYLKRTSVEFAPPAS